MCGVTLPIANPVAAAEPSVQEGNVVYELSDNKKRWLDAQACGGYWDKGRQAYCILNPTAREAAIAIALFRDVLNRHPELLELRDSAYQEARPTDYATDVGLTLDPVLNGVTLYDWQNVDGGYMRAIMERDGGANILWDMGLGKTTLSAGFIQKMGAQRTLVVCRNDAKDPVWRAQLEALLPDQRLAVLPNPKGKREDMLEQLAEYDTDADDYHWPLVFIIHYEALALIAGTRKKPDNEAITQVLDGWDKLPEWDLMIFDEGHRLASMNPNTPVKVGKNTQLGKATMRARARARYAVNLTGSAVMNHPNDLFGQLHYLYPDRYARKGLDWEKRYLDFVETDHKRVCIGWKPETLTELRDELGVFSVHRKIDDVLDLPPMIHQEIKLDLLLAQRKAYEEMRDQYWAEVESGVIKAANALAHLTQLRQIATWVEGLPSAKIDFTLSTLEEEPDAQFAVFTWYKPPGRALADLLGDQAVVVDGDVSAKQRAAALESHRLGRSRVLIGSIATIGESLNLQYMHQAIRLDRHWNPGVNAQTERRLHRHGQTDNVVLRDLIARDTVDELRVQPALTDKESLRKAVFGG